MTLAIFIVAYWGFLKLKNRMSCAVAEVFGFKIRMYVCIWEWKNHLHLQRRPTRALGLVQ